MARYSYTDGAGLSSNIYYGTHVVVGDHSEASAGADIFAGDGDDTVFLDDSVLYQSTIPTNDSIDLGDGYDYAFAGSGDDTVLGGAGDDRIFGDQGYINTTEYYSNKFWGTGNDSLDGGEGNDYLIGGAGRDTLIGGDGNDILSGEDVQNDGQTRMEVPSATDILNGGIGDDTLNLYGKDVGRGGAGNDLLYVVVMADDVITDPITIDGGAGSDSVSLILDIDADVDFFFETPNLLNFTFSGIERITSIRLLQDGNDSITGSSFAEDIQTGGGQDTIHAGDGNDGISKETGVGLVFGEDGDDYIAFQSQASGTINGGAGNDTIDSRVVYSSPDEYRGGDLTVIGGYGNDKFTPSTSGVYLFRPGAGNDTISVVGYPYTDLTLRPDDEREITIDYSDVKSGVRINLTAGTARGGAGVDVIPLVDDVIGSKFADTIAGDSTANQIDSGSAADAVSGMAGNDTIYGGRGYDTLDGGAGNDTIQAGLENDSIDGGIGKDAINGDEGDDSVFGDDGNDFINGGDGDDTVSGGAGNDTIVGGDGTDVVNYLIENGTQGVTVYLSSTTASTDSFGGKDTISEIESVRGTLLDDKIVGDNANNSLIGSAGNDTLTGGAGSDTLTGSAGDDTLYGTKGSDLLSGSDGNDALDGGQGADTLAGGLDNDTLNGSEGDDVLGGGTGDDTLTDINIAATNVDFDWLLAFQGSGNDMDGEDGSDTLFGAGWLRGGDGNDTISGIGLLDGEAGDDVLIVKKVAGVQGILPKLIGGLGADDLRGGLQAIASYEYSAVGVKVSLELGTAIGAAGDVDKLTGINNILASAFDDNLTGANGKSSLLNGLAGNDTIRGLTGADVLNGGDGNDVISTGTGSAHDSVTGGAGNDTITAQSFDSDMDGGIGNDTFVFNGTSGAATGGAGNDTFRVLKGSADINGGGGADHYVIMKGVSAINIVGFDHVSEQLDLSDFGIASFAALKALGQTITGSVEFDLGPNTVLRLAGVSLNSLDAGDFIL